MDIRPRTVALEHTISSHNSRIAALEEWKQQSLIYDATKDEQIKSMQALFNMRFTALEEKLSAIGGTMTWIMRLVIGGLIGGAIAFALRGGFNLP